MFIHVLRGAVTPVGMEFTFNEPAYLSVNNTTIMRHLPELSHQECIAVRFKDGVIFYKDAPGYVAVDGYLAFPGTMPNVIISHLLDRGLMVDKLVDVHTGMVMGTIAKLISSEKAYKYISEFPTFEASTEAGGIEFADGVYMTINSEDGELYTTFTDIPKKGVKYIKKDDTIEKSVRRSYAKMKEIYDKDFLAGGPYLRDIEEDAK